MQHAFLLHWHSSLKIQNRLELISNAYRLQPTAYSYYNKKILQGKKVRCTTNVMQLVRTIISEYSVCKRPSQNFDTFPYMF
jgi:hypothetical protein